MYPLLQKSDIDSEKILKFEANNSIIANKIKKLNVFETHLHTTQTHTDKPNK